MIRDAILKTKRDELGNCITSRKRKLQELYDATASFARSEPLHLHTKPDTKAFPTYGEAEFLEANNIHEGRFFDVSTLRRVPGAELIDYHDPNTIPTNTNRTSGLDTLTGLTLVHSYTPKESQDGCKEYANTSKSVPGPPGTETRFFGSPQQSSRGIQVSLPSTEGKEGNRGTIFDNAEQDIRSGLSLERPTAMLQPSSWLVDGKYEQPALDSEAPKKLSSVANPSLGIGVVAKGNTQHDISQNTSGDIGQRSSQLSDIMTRQSEASTTDSKRAIPHVDPVPDTLSSEKLLRGLGQQPGITTDLANTRQSYMYVSTEQEIETPVGFDLDKTQDNPVASVSDNQLSVSESSQMKPSQPIQPQPNFTDSNGSHGSAVVVHGASGKSLHLPNSGEHVNQPYRSAEEASLFVRRAQPSHEGRIPGMTRDMSKDLMFSQRPPMRIDTGVLSRNAHESYEKTQQHRSVGAQTSSTSSTPIKATPTTAHPSPPERMTTRVSSGALRHKSVSEILGETPRTTTHHVDRTPIDRGGNEQQSQDSLAHGNSRYGQLVASPESVSFRSRLSELEERKKERSKLSTVVFARQQATDSSQSTNSALQKIPDTEHRSDVQKDYLVTLFTAQASAQQPPLNALLGSAHKTLTTANHYLEFHEQQDCRILKRIYHLQNSNRWSLRQLERSIEPQRPTTQWDILLGHMKWMQTDFREERKWKLTIAKNLADWCAEWFASSSGRRASLQVVKPKVTFKSRASNSHATPVSLANSRSSRSECTPELIHSAEDDLSDAMEETIPHHDIMKVPAPAAVFSLALEDVVFSLDKTPVSDKLMAELPLYQPLNDIAEINLKDNVIDMNWNTPLVPISKFAAGKMLIRAPVVSRKRSRYEYEEDSGVQEDLSAANFLFSGHASDPIPAEKDDVALFNPENKHIIDRLHAAHAFRPPSEFSMPSQSFFESRNCSQWTWNEDDELRRLVKEYAYNWSLISSCLSTPSMFTSGAERRTPWECFERWVSFEGLPGDMSRTQYFRTWHSRRDAARSLLNQQIATQQQQTTNSSQTQVRRRTAEPMRVDRRRNSKHLALVHAMQKVAKKKETTIQKQQHVASLAAMRKATEATQPRQRMQTPQEFSRFKFERDCKLQERVQERVEIMRQQQLASQRANHLARVQQLSQHPGGHNMPQQTRNAISGPTHGTSPHLASSLPVSAAASAHSHSRSLPQVNGTLSNGVQVSIGQNNMRGGGIPQAPMQPHMQGQQRVPNDMRILMEASRLQQEQQQYLAAQRQQRYPTSNLINGGASSPQTVVAGNTPQSNAAMLVSLQAANGKLSPTNSGISGSARLSASPQLANAVQAQQLSGGMTPVVNQIATQLKLQHPNASPEHIKQMLTERLNQHHRSVNSQAAMLNSQAAMQAAAGGNLTSNGLQLPQQPGMGFGSGMLNPQMYAQYMHSQQSTQQNRIGANGLNGIRPSSRGNTPQIRNGTAQAGPGSSPRPPQAQMAGTQ